MASVKHRVFGVSLLLAACGDPVAPADWRGEPLVSYEAMVRPGLRPEPGVLDLPAEHYRMAVFWGPLDVEFGDLDVLVEQPGTSRPIAALEQFTLHLFDPPPPGVVHDGVAFGRAVLFADLDGDTHKGADDPFNGAAKELGFIYAATALDADRSPTGAPLAAGHHLVRLPLPAACGLEPPAPGPRDCAEVPLGATCTGDADCAGGQCLLQTSLAWPKGTCARPAQCADGGAWLPTESVYVAPCASTADCRDLYRCDPGLGACLPDPGIAFVLGRTPTGPMFCGRPLGPPR